MPNTNPIESEAQLLDTIAQLKRRVRLLEQNRNMDGARIVELEAKVAITAPCVVQPYDTSLS
jgi:hypothetical protein